MYLGLLLLVSLLNLTLKNIFRAFKEDVHIIIMKKLTL